MRVVVPKDHGATDVVRQEAAAAVVTPHRYPGDTYPSLWFFFQVVNDTAGDLPRARLVIEGLVTGRDTYEPFWKHCLWSRDGVSWERIPDGPQCFGDTTLTIQTPLRAGESVWVAEAFPLPYARYERLCAALARPPASGLRVDRHVLAHTAQGRPIHAFCIRSERAGPDRPLLVVAGQHAVEQSGKILAETLLTRCHSGAVAGTPLGELLERSSVWVVPLANPDGCYEGRMNSNAAGTVMDAPDDDSIEMRAQLALVDAIRPRVLLNCHGWGNEYGFPPYEDLYRWTDEDPLFVFLKAHVPGCSSAGSPHWLGDAFRLESHARARHGTECAIVEINWNWYVPPEGGPPRQPSWRDVEARAWQYLLAAARYCLN